MTADGKRVYGYSGPVTRFGKPYCREWTAYTEAVSPEAARRNLEYKFRKSYDLTENAKIELKGELRVIAETSRVVKCGSYQYKLDV